jgi:hypothetical protein
MIMIVEQLVEWMTGRKTEVFGEDLAQHCHGYHRYQTWLALVLYPGQCDREPATNCIHPTPLLTHKTYISVYLPYLLHLYHRDGNCCVYWQSLVCAEWKLWTKRIKT